MIRANLIISILLFACGGSDDVRVATPSTTATAKLASAACPTNDNGDRPGYHVDSGQWIRDCNTPWTREYYRVFTRPAGQTTTASLLPRPDGTTAMAKLCARNETRPVLDRYGWCDPVVEPSRVNAMSTDDAIAIAHALHHDLKFTASRSGVAPYPMPDDVAAVCEADRIDPAIDEACDAYAARATEIAMIPSEKSAIAMAAALNKLYGI